MKKSLFLVLIALLSAAIMFTGCPTGSSTDPDDGSGNGTDGGDTGGDTGGGGNRPGGPDTGGTSLKPNPEGAAALQAPGGLNFEPLGEVPRDEVVSVQDNVVTLLKHVQLVDSVNGSFVRRSRTLGDIDSPIKLASFEIPPGVVFKVAPNASLDVMKGSITVNAADNTYYDADLSVLGPVTVKVANGIKAGGKITVSKDANATKPGTITLEPSATIAVREGGTIVVEKSAKVVVPASATVSVAASATVEVNSGGTVEVSGALNVASGATVSVNGTGGNAGTIDVKSGGKVDNKGTINGSGGALTVEAGGTVTLTGGAKADLKDLATVTVAESGGIHADTGTTVSVSPEGGAAGNITGNGTVEVGGTKVDLKVDTPAISYDSTTLKIAYTFSAPVVPKADVTGWTLSPAAGGTPSASLTATYGGTDKGPVTLAFTAVAGGSELPVSTPAAAIDNATFTRSAAATYTVAYYGEFATGTDNKKHKIAGLKTVTTNGNPPAYPVGATPTSVTPTYYLLPADDTHFSNIFKTIYEPNKAGSTTDSIESGKTTVSYDAAISDKVLDLFQVALDASDTTKDVVYLTGSDLPTEAATGASNTHLIVIDIGLPGTAANTSLPTFKIPLDTGGTDGTGKGTLGNGTASYSHIRLRVNKGAELVILAGNSAYLTAGGATHSCAEGGFKGGCVEVMAGGKLRDGAFEGFPLGNEAVILNRHGSYLSVGPEPTDATVINSGAGKAAYDAFYAGYLIGPSSNTDAEKPRITWEGSDGYLEVRPGRLAISSNVTVRKLLGLIYDAYFFPNTTVTIADGGMLAANDRGEYHYDFFGVNNTAKIIVQQGGVIDIRFLVGNEKDATYETSSDNPPLPSPFLTPAANKGPVTISNDKYSPVTVGTAGVYTNTITGYQNWKWTEADLVTPTSD